MSLFFCRNAHGVGRADLSDAASRFGPEWFRVLYIIFQKAIFQQPHDLSPK